MKLSTAFVAIALLPACMSESGPDVDREEIVREEIAVAAPSATSLAEVPQAAASGNLDVTLGVHARRDHRYLWDMTLTAPAPITLAPGAVQRVSFPVDIVNTGTVDTGAVDGTIQVVNHGKRNQKLLGVLAQVGTVAATVTCPSPFPVVLRAGRSLSCTYVASLPDASDRSVVAVAYGSDVAYALQPVLFSDPSTPTQDYDRVVEATAPGVGHVYLTDARFEPVVHTSFSREVGPYAECGPQSFVAYAFLRALNGSGSLRSGLLMIDRSAALGVTVACGAR